MSKAENIRNLAREGLAVADIARQMGIRYQHVYNVLKRCNMLPGTPRSYNPKSRYMPIEKPSLYVDELLKAGFEHGADWLLTDEGAILLTQALPKECAVYAMAKHGQVLYVGVATMGLAKRMRFYSKPGKSQKTSKRLNIQITEELKARSVINLYFATPEDMLWNGLPVHGSAGLELGLIKKYSLPWNIRSTH